MDAYLGGGGYLLRTGGYLCAIGGAQVEGDGEDAGPFAALPVPAARWGRSYEDRGRLVRQEFALWTAAGAPVATSVAVSVRGTHGWEEGEHWAVRPEPPPHWPAGHVSPPASPDAGAGGPAGPWRWEEGRGWVPLTRLLAELAAGDEYDRRAARDLARAHPDATSPGLLAAWAAGADDPEGAARDLVARHPHLACPDALVAAGFLDVGRAALAAPRLRDAWARALGPGGREEADDPF